MASLQSANFMGLRVRASVKTEQPAWLRIGNWLVKPNENTLSNKTSRQNLEPKLMNLLLWLAQHANEVQSNEVLLQHVWGGTFYSDSPLHRSIAVLRRALGDSAANPSFIRTVRKRGYQLIASVSWPDSLSCPDRAPVPIVTQTHFGNRIPFPALDPLGAADASVYFVRKNTALIQVGLTPPLQQSAAPLTMSMLAQSIRNIRTLRQPEPLQQLLERLCEWHIAGRRILLAHELRAALELSVDDIDIVALVLKCALALSPPCTTLN